MFLAHYMGYSVYGNCLVIPYEEGLREKVHPSVQRGWEVFHVPWVCPNKYLLQKIDWFWEMGSGSGRWVVGDTELSFQKKQHVSGYWCHMGDHNEIQHREPDTRYCAMAEATVDHFHPRMLMHTSLEQ